MRARATRHAEALASVLEDQTARTLQTVDVTLAEVAGRSFFLATITDAGYR